MGWRKVSDKVSDVKTMNLTEFLLARIAEDEGSPPTCSRVLADCEAKRRIVERHRSKPDTGGWYCAGCGDDWPCEDLRDLASVYADHPDYDEAWRP
jgi:hypothetical protein